MDIQKIIDGVFDAREEWLEETHNQNEWYSGYLEAITDLRSDFTNLHVKRVKKRS